MPAMLHSTMPRKRLLSVSFRWAARPSPERAVTKQDTASATRLYHWNIWTPKLCRRGRFGSNFRVAPRRWRPVTSSSTCTTIRSLSAVTADTPCGRLRSEPTYKGRRHWLHHSQASTIATAVTHLGTLAHTPALFWSLRSFPTRIQRLPRCTDGLQCRLTPAECHSDDVTREHWQQQQHAWSLCGSRGGAAAYRQRQAEEQTTACCAEHLLPAILPYSVWGQGTSQFQTELQRLCRRLKLKERRRGFGLLESRLSGGRAVCKGANRGGHRHVTMVANG